MSDSHMLNLLTSATTLATAANHGVLGPRNPPWPPAYDMASSTLSMTCNGSGWSSPQLGAQFGIISYDWSNAKAQWAAASPMDCEERLATQAASTAAYAKAHQLPTRAFVYRNVVKALPWFTSVREKILDPAYSGWFLRFDPHTPRSELNVPACAAENASKCSPYYHDQEQTPAVPTAAAPHPDGSCLVATGCDCGDGMPCGEYLWDHRNGSMLRDWLVAQHIGGPNGIGHPDIDGLFIDDFWCSNLICEADPSVASCPCNDPVQGPTEINRDAQLDMGLSDEDVRDLTLAWNETMGAVQESILAKGAYTWSLMFGQGNANAAPQTVDKVTCVEKLRSACLPSSPWQQHTVLFGLKHNGSVLTQLEEDVAFFLLARGPYAYAGWGSWGMSWPLNPEPAHGALPPQPHGVVVPSLLRADFGKPDGLCAETVPGKSGIFTREWSGATVTLDCGTFKGTVKRK